VLSSRATINSAAKTKKEAGKRVVSKKIVFDTLLLNLLNSVACKHISFQILRHWFRRRML
jgi:hypothetical protein